ncbi:MAG: PorT family protein [Dysgonamonadaceae bacterium]|nr:PorT family protein [Dysgonamonadaceae bacterium]
MKKIILFVILLIHAHNSYSQIYPQDLNGDEIKWNPNLDDIFDESTWELGDSYLAFGLKGSINASNIKSRSWQAGIMVNCIFESTPLSIQPELLGSYYGTNSGYIQLPINLRYGFMQITDYIIPVISVGLYGGLSVYDKTENSTNSTNTNVVDTDVIHIDINTSTSMSSRYPHFDGDWGLNIGLGIDIWHFQLLANYSYGFRKFYYKDNEKTRNNGFSVSLAFMIY